MKQTARRVLFLPLVAAVLAGCNTAPNANLQPQAVTRNPILFVHGWNSDGSTWNPMITNFKNAGWTDAQLFNWTYNTSQSNAVTADQIRQKVDTILAQTGATKVDIISHSMGGLSSRYYLKNLGGTAKVDAWVSLGGPNHGTDTAYGCFSTACVEMRGGSTFVKNLNSGDETPGTVRYGTWWSPCDLVINPDSSVPLSGATNTQTACLDHTVIHQNSTVFAQVKTFIDQ